MAISDNYNSLTFGGVNSLDYGIFISGPGVYNAPTRAVEFVDVPGRNGAIEIDQGHWNNIEVTYTCGTFATDQAEFGEKMNDFRNAIVSQTGYQRLTDTYNPEHYRLGLYANGIEVEPVRHNDAAEFTLVFNCKPQRYLTSGDTEVTVASGGTITNPTLYEARPLLKVYVDPNYASVDGTESVTLTSATSGESHVVELMTGPTGNIQILEDYDFNTSTQSRTGPLPPCYIYITNVRPLINSGDTFSIFGLVTNPLWLSGASSSSTSDYLFSEVVGVSSGDYSLSAEIEPGPTTGSKYLRVRMQHPTIILTSANNWQNRKTVTYYVDVAVGNPTKAVARLTVVFVAYFSAPNVITLASSSQPVELISGSSEYLRYIGYDSWNQADHINLLSVNSTKSIQGDPTYIDTEIGEAYKIISGKHYGLNQYVSLGSDLPKLFKGNTSVTCSSHIKDLQLKMNPRWWEL